MDGEQLGIVKIPDALRLSEQHDVDLVEIAPNAVPPVCRLMDYGKFKYQEQKRQQEARAKQKIIQVKEVKFRPGTDEGDYQVKLRNLRRFIDEGDKAKVTLRFRGREMAHQELGMRVLERVRDDLAEICTDLLHGLSHHLSGRHLEALWWWQFSYLSTWGPAASGALRALQSVVAHVRLGVPLEDAATDDQ